MTVESTTQALCDLALRFGEGDEESMVITHLLFLFIYPIYAPLPVKLFAPVNWLYNGNGLTPFIWLLSIL